MLKTTTEPFCGRGFMVPRRIQALAVFGMAYVINDCLESRAAWRPFVLAMAKELSGMVTDPLTLRFATLVVPVKEVGPVTLALASKAVWRPLVLAIVKELFGIITVPDTVRLATVVVPVKVVGPARLALRARALVAAVERGLSKSEVLLTWSRPISPLVTLELKVG